MPTPNIRINAREHTTHPLRVHDLLSDFELEDVWRAPVTLLKTHSLHLFLEQFAVGNGQLAGKGMTGFLFNVRFALGKLLNWDEKLIHDHLIPGSIRFRYAQQENKAFDDLPPPGLGSFIPVYNLENESLSEIDNATVHAAVHFSRVPSGPGTWTIHMAVYVKPKGWLGRVYMQLIKPFRHLIVYPALMLTARQNWEELLRLEATRTNTLTR